ncbi:uncharacterized protein [Diadema setosum]|uniref:uncharacterized protein n=1 Tax=Diadema setosum TaxID=31175 RepID=UPI003B3A3C61
MGFSYTYGIYIYPVKFEMRVECYEGTPPVKLVDGPSPFEGLVVIKPDSYVCHDGFTAKAAEVICGELGFPAAEEYSPKTLLSTAKRNNYQRLSCPEGNSFQRVMYCSPATTRCPSKQIVRLKCRDSLGSCNNPGHMYHGYWNSSITEFGSRLTLTCVEGYVINGSATLQCVVPPGWSTYFPVWNASVPSCLRVGDNAHEVKVIVYVLGTPLPVIFALLILSTAWCNWLRKRRHRHPHASNQPNDHSNDRQLQHPRETNRGFSLNPARADSSTLSCPLTDKSKLETLSAQQENPEHVYQDITEVDKMPCHHAGVEATSLTHEYLSLQETPLEQNDCCEEHEYATRIWK